MLSIPKLAQRLGVTPASVRGWVDIGHINPPSTITASGENAFSADAVDEIELWYMERASTHSTRGPGAAARRERARLWLAAKKGVAR